MIQLSRIITRHAPRFVRSIPTQPVRVQLRRTIYVSKPTFSNQLSVPLAAAIINEDHLVLDLGTAKNRSTVIYHVWLRDNCPCAECIHPTTRQKLHASGDIPSDIKPVGVNWVRTNTAGDRPKQSAEPCMYAAEDSSSPWALQVEWPAFPFISRTPYQSSANKKTHVSRYPLSFLRRHAVGAVVDPIPQPWSGADEHMHIDYTSLPALADLVPVLGDCSRTIAERTRLCALRASLPLEILDRIATHGLLFINNVPTDMGTDYVETVAKRFGHSLRNTFYGLSWDVKSEPDSRNIAYTNLNLGLHMDLMYYETPPGLQFLHMLKKTNVCGGTSMFMDMHHAWGTFVSTHARELVEVLVQVPTQFHYAHATHPKMPHWMIRSHPLATNEQGSGFHYAPPFQAPQKHSSQIPLWYRAMRAWESHLQNVPRMHVDLQPGDLVVFHNRRVLHGRTAFSEQSPGKEEAVRHLRGCYVDFDEFADLWRVAQYEKETGV